MMKKLLITTALTGLMMSTAAAQSTNPTSGAQQSSPPAATQKETSPPPVSQQSSPARPDMRAAADVKSPQFVSVQKPDQWLASKFKGTDVIGADNKSVGSVSDVLFNKDGKIEAYVVSVGGFLGMGAKDVAIAPASFQVMPGDKTKNESDKLKISMKADDLKQVANFEPYNPPRANPTSTMSRPVPASPTGTTRSGG